MHVVEMYIRGITMILISSCLVGENVRYDGKNKLQPALLKLIETGQARAVCPEILGGLPIPRNPAEIVGGDGYDVLNHRARVMDSDGNDVTAMYLSGAQKTLEQCKAMACKAVILKSDSPSCGSKQIYSGAFNSTKKEGVGVCTALLRQNGITVYDEDDYLALLSHKL